MTWNRRPIELYAPDDLASSGGTVPDTTVTVSTASTSANPPQQGENWEVKYKQLQTSYNKLFDDNKRAIEENTTLKTTVADLQGQVRTLTEEKGRVETDLGTRAKEIEVERAAHNTTRLEAARNKLILAEFPQLAKFEAAGTLPTAASVEEMRTKFTAFADTLKELVGANVSSTLQGASPPAPTTQAEPMTVDQVYENMMRVAGIPGKESEYLKLRSLYDTMLDEDDRKRKKS